MSVFLFLNILNLSFAKQLHPVTRDLPGIDITTRKQRGADESLLFDNSEGHQSVLKKLEINKKELAELKKTDFDAWLKKKEEIYKKNKAEKINTTFLLKNFASQFDVDFKLNFFKNKQLRWPRAYHDNKIAIVIHHTADYADIEKLTDKDEKITMQNIYKYHAVTRGWGDIGYNFVIGPSGKIYEGKAGGPGIIGAHTKYNNSFSLGISLMGNFNIHHPTSEQLSSLKKLITELAYKYDINPYEKVTFHRIHHGEHEHEHNHELEHISNHSIIGHKDAGWTACPGVNLYNKLGEIRKDVYQNLQKKSKKRTDKVQVGFKNNKDKIKKLFFSKGFGSNYIKTLKRKYLAKHNFNKAKSLSVKYLTNADKITSLSQKSVKVLLRELSLNYKTLNFKCENNCGLRIDGKKLKSTVKNIKFELFGEKNIYRIFGKYKIPLKNVEIFDVSGGIIKITNYDRKSYFGIDRNEFRGKINIQKDKIFDKKRGIFSSRIVINTLSLNDYLHGIVETNDDEHFEKNKVMALLAKNYIIHYLDSNNKHPNIPVQSNYNAIDDPDYFQKYVGAGVDKTLKKWKLALELTKSQFIYFVGGDGKFKTKKLAFTPYFSCSPGFTRDAVEKFGRTNLPYLSSRIDFAKCENFQGHGVGASGKGANLLAKKGFNYVDIIKYYYPGVTIE